MFHSNFQQTDIEEGCYNLKSLNKKYVLYCFMHQLNIQIQFSHIVKGSKFVFISNNFVYFQIKIY